jgi:hypothetical protein
MTMMRDDNDVDVTYKNELLLHGHRVKTTKLWTVPLAIQDTPTTNSLIHPHSANHINQTQRPAELVAFAHAALLSPSITTLANALNNNFIIGFPGLNTNTLRTYPPASAATVKGHLDQLRKNTQLTKPHALAQIDTEAAYALHVLYFNFCAFNKHRNGIYRPNRTIYRPIEFR